MSAAVTGQHWHAYSWSGRRLPSHGDRRNPELACPPYDIREWLLKPAEHLRATYVMPDGRLSAYQWLRAELERHPRSPRDVPVDVQLAYTVERMSRWTDVVWGYWSAAGRYISRSLIVCPRDGRPCPY